ncbi:MAG: DUF6870 family protein [Ruminococcus sp.]
MFKVDELERLKEVNIQDVARENLVSYSSLIDNDGKTYEDRIRYYMEHAGENPYFYEDNGYVVKSVLKSHEALSFADCTKQLVARRAGKNFI